MVNTMTPSKYQPATRDMRTSIETQDLLTQAAFWSKEYQLNPADLEAAVKLASAVRKMGNASKAAEITQTTRSMYPDDPYLIAEHAAALIALEKGQDALRPLDNALHSAPGYARLWSLKGAALDQIGKYDQARLHYNRALQITPNDPNILANMGLSYALAGDPASAEQWLRRASNHQDAGDGIRQNLNLVLQLQGKPIQPGGMINQSATASAQGPGTQRRLQPGMQPGMQQSMQPGMQQKMRPQTAPQTVPQARGVYTPQTQNMRQPMANPAHFGHRASVMSNQHGAPRTAAGAARAASGQQYSRPPQQSQMQAPQQQGNILDQISRSVNGRRAAGPFGSMPSSQPAPTPGGYPAPQQLSQMQQQQIQQAQPQQPQAQQPYMNYEGAPERRRAARRR